MLSTGNGVVNNTDKDSVLTKKRKRSAGPMLCSDTVMNDVRVPTFDSGVRDGLSEYQGARHGNIGGRVFQEEGSASVRGLEKRSMAGAQWAGGELGEMKSEQWQGLDATELCEPGQDASW